MLSSSEAIGNPLLKDPLTLWRSRLSAEIESFLFQVKEQIVDIHLQPEPILMSYVPDGHSALDIETGVAALKKHLSIVGIPVTCSAFTDAKTLEQALSKNTFAIVLCTPAYAKKVEAFPEIRTVLDRFGQIQKNALQPLLCEGDFSSTALKIVDGHYLIRTYKEILSGNTTVHPLLSLESFVDVVLMLSGQSGLGLLPDILGLKDKSHLQAEALYKALLLDFKAVQEQLTINYHLSVALEKTINNHPFKPYLSNSLPVIQEDVGPGFNPILEHFLSPASFAKISLFLCASSADVQLANLALSLDLKERGLRVLSIDCARYAGRAAKDCIRLALNELKIHNREPVFSKPLVILLKGYQDLGAYDNLMVDNKLAAWPHLKVIVTCRSDFFRSRGYLSCFLSNNSERKIEDLVVYKVPSFASLEAKKASIPLIAPQVLEPALDESLAPKTIAQQEELRSYLNHLREAWIHAGYLQSNPAQNPKIFISYAWESTEHGARARQQSHLLRLAQDLRMLDLRPWLDLEQMTGDINEQMAGNIQDSDFALVMGTPLYKSRAAQATNVQKEYEALLEQEQQQAIKILPLQFLGSDPSTAFPEALQHRTEIMNFQGIDQSEDYLYRMSDPHQGLVSKLLGIETDPQKFALYQSLYTQFQEQLSLLPAKHLVVQANQSIIQSLDVDNRLKGLIEPFALKEEHLPLSTRFNLSAYLNHFLEKPHAKTLVLLGRAGSGKSLFALNTLKTLLESWHAYRENPKKLPTWLPVYIPLRIYNQNPEHCLSEALKQQCVLHDLDIESLRIGLGKTQQVLFICDGYDELGAGVRPNLSHQLEYWPHAKLLVTARPEHFAEQSLRPVNGSIDLIYVSPFVPNEIKSYVAHYEREHSTDTYQTLEKLPGMMGLLENPFLLTMVLQSLPQLLKNHQADKAITRSDIYEAFIQTWFLQEIKGRDLTMAECQDFSEELAFELFKAGTLSPSSAYPSLWTFFEDETHGAARDAAPLRLSGGEYTFIHKSLYEYFACRYLWKSLNVEQAFQAFNLLWNTRSLLEQHGIINFLVACYKQAQIHSMAPYLQLMELINQSKIDPQKTIGASNAITLLVLAGVSFSDVNLSKIRIPGADLTGGIFDSADFSNADLRNVTFTGAWLRGANFQESYLENIKLGELPSIVFEDECVSCCYYPFLGKKDLSGHQLLVADHGFYQGRILFAVASGPLIKLYDAKNFDELQIYKGHTKDIISITFNSSGLEIVSGSWDGTFRRWNLEGKCLQIYQSDTEAEISSVAFNPNGLELASGSGNTVFRWNLEGKCLKVYEGHTNDVTSIIFSPSGLELASASRDKTVRRWSLDGQCLQIYEDHNMGPVESIVFSPSGLELISGSWDSVVRRWSLDGQCLQIYEGHSYSINSLCFTADGLEIISASDDETIRRWSLDGQCLQIYKGHSNKVKNIAFSPDGLEIASASRDKTVRRWDVKGARLKVNEGHTEEVKSVAFSPNGLELASASRDKTVRRWSLYGDCLQTYEGHIGTVSDVVFSPNSLELVSGSWDRSLRRWSLKGQCLQDYMVHRDRVFSIDFSPDGQELVSGSKDWTIRRWSLDGQCLRIYDGHTWGVTSVIFSPDGRELVSASGDSTIRRWSLDGQCLQVYEGDGGGVKSIAFSPDGLELASISRDNVVRLWNLKNHQISQVYNHTSTITSIAFNPVGLELALGAEDGTICIWFANHEEASKRNRWTEANKRLLKTDSPVNSIAWSSKGIHISTGHEDGTVRCWKILQDGAIHLLWNSHQLFLNTENFNLDNTVGLSQPNALVFKQRGVIDPHNPFFMFKAKVEPILTEPLISHNVFSKKETLQLNTVLEKYKLSKENFLPDVETAFRRAAFKGSKEDIQFLMKFIKNINVQDENPKNRKTALHWTAIKQHCDVFIFLVEQGARLDIEDADGKTAEDYVADADREIQCYLGTIYEDGKVVKQDYIQAIDWYTKSANQEHAKAQCALGRIYMEGLGIQQDIVQGFQWYKKAAEGGNAEAQFKIGGMYFNGHGVGPDKEQAMQWYRMAAAQGYGPAQFEIDKLCQLELDVKQNANAPALLTPAYLRSTAALRAESSRVEHHQPSRINDQQFENLSEQIPIEIIRTPKKRCCFIL